ncbi:MAG: hypothetical protein ACREUP_00860 [Burkholderiales bacterium]
MRVFLSVMLVFFALGARAETVVRVVATDPDIEATLGRDETFYVRVEFTTDRPVSIWARPYFQGKPVQRTKFNPSAAHSGAGHALGWFSLDQADAVDEVRIKLGGGKPYREWEAASYPVRLTGTGLPVAQRSRPAWVNEMLREERERSQQAYERQMSGPVSTGGMLFMSFFMLTVLGLLVVGAGAPLWGVWKWRGGWRIAAAVPALAMAFVIGRIVVDTARDPTSHNLWPFEILMWGGASAVWMGVLALMKRVVGRKSAGDEPPEAA